jgi:hypothetical protein
VSNLDADALTEFVTTAWFFVTPPLLTVAVIVMGIAIWKRGTWRRLMPRASFLLLTSYAVIMDRYVIREVAGIEDWQQPWSFLVGAFAFGSAVYFLYAILKEWVWPFVHSLWPVKATRGVRR